MPVIFLTQEKITQTSSGNREHKQSEIERFSTFNERISQTTPSLSIIVNKFSDLH